jgi:hypothetical protein
MRNQLKSVIIIPDYTDEEIRRAYAFEDEDDVEQEEKVEVNAEETTIVAEEVTKSVEAEIVLPVEEKFEEETKEVEKVEEEKKVVSHNFFLNFIDEFGKEKSEEKSENHREIFDRIWTILREEMDENGERLSKTLFRAPNSKSKSGKIYAEIVHNPLDLQIIRRRIHNEARH